MNTRYYLLTLLLLLSTDILAAKGKISNINMPNNHGTIAEDGTGDVYHIHDPHSQILPGLNEGDRVSFTVEANNTAVDISPEIDDDRSDEEVVNTILRFVANKSEKTPTPTQQAIEPEIELDKMFLMPIEDVFSITGRGTVVTGRIERGIIHTGEVVEIIGFKDNLQSTVTSVDMFRKLHNDDPSNQDMGVAGDFGAILLRGIEKTDIERGAVLAMPDTITPHKTFLADVYILKKEEGGRHTPFHNKYRTQFYFRTTDITGTVTLPKGREMVMPGDNITFEVDLISPVAIDQGLRFAIREGGRTVGTGQISEIIK